MRFWIDDDAVREDIQRFKKSIIDASVAAGRAETKEIADQLRDKVVDLIPNEGGWYDIYKRSVIVQKLSEDNYVVTTTLSEVKFTELQADRTLLWIGSGDDVATVLAQHNPWSIDTLPSVVGGFKADIIVKPSSESETEHYRRERLIERPEIDKQIKVLGEVVNPVDAELPLVNGKVLADVPFLAMRLEYGLGGFPRVPIWSRLDYEFKEIARNGRTAKVGDSIFSKRWFGKQ